MKHKSIGWRRRRLTDSKLQAPILGETVDGAIASSKEEKHKSLTEKPILGETADDRIGRFGERNNSVFT